jgi:Tetratricopeptide repeat
VLATISAVEVLGDASLARGLAAVYCSVAWTYYATGRYSEQLVAARRGEELARGARDDALLVQLMRLRIAAGSLMGEDTHSCWPELQALSERVGNLAVLSFCLQWESDDHLFNTCEVTTAMTYIDRALEVAEQRGAPDEIVWMLTNGFSPRYVVGAWASAREQAERALRIAQAMESASASLVSCVPLVCLGVLDIAEGRDGELEPNAERAARLARSIHYAQGLLWAAWPLAERDLVAGRAADAYALLESLLVRHDTQGEAGHLWSLMAWAELELGKDDRVAATIATSLARPERLFYVDTKRVRAMLAIKQQRWPDAVAALEETLTMCRAMPYPYAEAKALYVYGQLHAAKGESERARERYQAALAICERLGEGLYRKHIERDLAALE